MIRPPTSHPGRARLSARIWEQIRTRMGWAVAAAYVAAAACPSPGTWLRHPRQVHGMGVGFRLEAAPLLLVLVLFAAGLQVPPKTLLRVLRRPATLLVGLTLHLAAPLVIIPALAAVLRWTPDTDGGSGMITALILITAMPVAAGATVWNARAEGDQPTMVGLVLFSTLLSPLTLPVTLGALSPLLSRDYARTLDGAARIAGQGFALTGVVLPCAAGLVCHLVLPPRALPVILRTAAPTAFAASLLLTYLNASGALGPFLTHPDAVLPAAAVTVAAALCALSFLLGRTGGRLLGLQAPARTCVTLACGMNNSSASAVLIGAAMPDRPHVLLPVLAYSLLQKLAAGHAARPPRRARRLLPACGQDPGVTTQPRSSTVL
ncbi:sodium-dependent transporter [Streptomyces sp. NPDC006670]|uniref:sodium-dependent transporter n=1 Tax=Streptomyces sp. NPDC006670 TaxID=3154476 RepID=UPI0033C6BBE3